MVNTGSQSKLMCSKNVDISILQLYYLFYSAEMLILMFNNNKYSQESHLVSLLYRPPKIF